VAGGGIRIGKITETHTKVVALLLVRKKREGRAGGVGGVYYR